MDEGDNTGSSFSLFAKKTKITPQREEETTKLVESVSKELQVKPLDDRLTFEDLGLNEWVVKCVNSMSIVKPTPVQVCDLYTVYLVEGMHTRDFVWKECCGCF